MNSMSNPHDHYRQQLQRVCSDEWKQQIIEYLAFSWPEWDHSKAWETCWSRFDPGSQNQPYLSLLLQQQDCSRHMCLIEISQREPVNDGGMVLLNDDPLGWIKVWRFPEEPVLKALPTVLTEFNNDFEILRYRPYNRCTFRCSGFDSSVPVFGKLFADQRGELIHHDSMSLWAAARARHLDFKVAKPIKWDSATGTVWQAAIHGQPLVDRLFSVSGAKLAGRIGMAAASLPASRLKPTTRFDGTAQMQRSIKYAKELSLRMPELADSITRLIHTLHRIHADSNNHKLRAIHGAPHAHQWLDCGDQLGLVDFDRYCLGDPELDAATFIGEMDFEDREHVPVDKLNAIFLDAYQSIAGKLDFRLLQAYHSHKRLAKALKAARSIRLNGDRKARRHLVYAFQAIKETV